MAIRDDFLPGEILAASDLNDTFAAKPTKTVGTATPTGAVAGDLFFDENDTPPTPKFFDGAVFQAIGGGKILQIVRATDATDRSTSSTSFVDASISVTITPTKSTSAILLIWSVNNHIGAGSLRRSAVQISDSSDNAISGAEQSFVGHDDSNSAFDAVTLIGFSTPATTAATTYKGRFRVVDVGTSVVLANTSSTGQLYAIEVLA